LGAEEVTLQEISSTSPDKISTRYTQAAEVTERCQVNEYYAARRDADIQTNQGDQIISAHPPRVDTEMGRESITAQPFQQGSDSVLGTSASSMEYALEESLYTSWKFWVCMILCITALFVLSIVGISQGIVV
jgi:hypothetical protein